MIGVKLNAQARDLMQYLEITPSQVEKAFNDRHRGVLIPGNPMRIGTIHWLTHCRAVFCIGTVSKSHREGESLYFEEVEAEVVLDIEGQLPAGNLNWEMDFNAILDIVARSFGLPVVTHADFPPKVMHYKAPWDGQINVLDSKGDIILLQGTFNPNTNECSYVWALSLNKYLKWYRGGEWEVDSNKTNTFAAGQDVTRRAETRMAQHQPPSTPLEQYMEPFNIRQAHVDETLAEPDILQKLEFGGLGINLYMKTSQESNSPSTVIVVESMISEAERVVDSVYTTYLQALGLSKETKPFAVLQTLAERFGVSLSILGKTANFFGKQTMSVPPGTSQKEIVRINEQCPVIGSFYFRMTSESVFDVAFAFAIKTEDYKSWLQNITE